MVIYSDENVRLASTWSDRELLKALENAALLRNKSNDTSETVNIQPKCLICVDGIEESASWPFGRSESKRQKLMKKILLA